MKKLRLGILGCGAISEQYFKSAKGVFQDTQEVVACADLLPERAKARAAEFGAARAETPEELLADGEVDLVVNLTVPTAHEELTVAALEHGKHVYTEKPFALSREGSERIAQAAAKAGKRVGCAPDTFLSAPMQTAKKLAEDGWIGSLVGFTAMCPMRGNEFWRPDADFFYQKGAGPVLDMAAYYLNTLVSIAGPIRSVTARSRISFPKRTIVVPPRRGEEIDVEVPTHVCAAIELECGALGTFTDSFDIWRSSEPFIELYGEKGTLILPDPNMYSGEVKLARLGGEWQVCPQLNEYGKNMRGAGIADMARAIAEGRPHRVGIELARHVTEAMLAFDESNERRCTVALQTTCPPIPGLYTEKRMLERA